MGDAPRLEPFQDTNSFLRRVSKPNAIREGFVLPPAFAVRTKEPSLSFTFQDSTLQSPEALEQYQIDNALPESGDLPGICMLTHSDLVKALVPPLPPRHSPDTRDERYGHLHCETDPPFDEAHQAEMAKLATRNGVVLDFIRKKKRNR